MNKTLQEGLVYSKQLKQIRENLSDNIELFIIPSYTSLAPLKKEIEGSGIKLGAQNMHWAPSGPFTGEISPEMLSEIGIDLVELGHSERRQYYNENDEDINKKAKAALEYQMNPLICIGESSAHKENGVGKEKLSEQLKIALKGITENQLDQVIIAYEPVWSIGENGSPASAEHVETMHSHIREVLRSEYGEAAENVAIIYGGSVNENNFKDYLKIEDVNGLFIGRAAWNIESFERILNKIHSAYQ